MGIVTQGEEGGSQEKQEEEEEKDGSGARLGIRRGMFRFRGRGEGRTRANAGRSGGRENVRDVRCVLWGRADGKEDWWDENRGALPIDLALLGYRHYSYEINLIYILQFSLTVPPLRSIYLLRLQE